MDEFENDAITYGHVGVKVDAKLEQSSLYLTEGLVDEFVIAQFAGICLIGVW